MPTFDNLEGYYYPTDHEKFDCKIQVKKDGDLKWVTKRVPTVDDARDWLFEQTRKKGNGSLLNGGRVEFSTYADHWLEETKKPQLATGTYQRYQRYIDTYYNPRFGDVPLNQLTDDHVRSLMNDVREKGLVKETMKSVYWCLHGILNDATKKVPNPPIDRNPASPVDIPNPKQSPKSNRESKIVTLPQTKFADFIRTARAVSSYCPSYYVMLTTGIRVGELLGLKWDDIDFEAATLTVKRSWSQLIEESHELKETKTTSGGRTICLPQRTMNVLNEHRHQQTVQPASEVAEDTVFLTDDGTHIDGSNYRRTFNKILETGDFNENLTPRCMRKSHGTWISRAFPVKEIADRLGHSTSGDTTLNHYIDTPEGMDREVADWLDENLPEV